MVCKNWKKSFITEYQIFYKKLLQTAHFENFNDERLNLTGETFRSLVKHAVSIVVNHYYSVEEKCDSKWDFHRFG